MPRALIELRGPKAIAGGALAPRSRRGTVGQVDSVRFGGVGPVIAIEYLVIGGGNGGVVGAGGGGTGFGGNAGGYRTNVAGATNGFGAALEPVYEIGAGTYTVIVGAGGSTNGGTGGSSQFGDIVTTAASGSTGLGAGGAGSGGPGLANSITGTSINRGGGGSPSGDYSNGNSGIDGGGGGGIYFNDYYGFAYKKGPGDPNTGGGGGGYYAGGTGFAGGSGVVIIRYVTATQTSLGLTITGGTVTTTGAYTVHSFTSTGTTSLVIS